MNLYQKLPVIASHITVILIRHIIKNVFYLPSGSLQEGPQHPEQADASEVSPADEAGDGPDHRHRRAAQRGHRPGL